MNRYRFFHNDPTMFRMILPSLLILALSVGGCAPSRQLADERPFPEPPPAATRNTAPTETPPVPLSRPDSPPKTLVPATAGGGAGSSPLAVDGGASGSDEARRERRVIWAGEPAAAATEAGKGGSGIVFNFDDADIYEVIRTFAETLGISYIVDPSVTGRVTLQTAGNLKKGDLFSVFYQVLEAGGLTAVREGELYKILPIKDAPRMPLRAVMGVDGRPLPPDERVMMQIIPLRHISAEEMTKILTPFISADGTILSHGDSNTLLLVDKGVNVFKALRLVSAFDVDVFQDMAHRFYQVQHIDVNEAVPLLTQILGAFGNLERLRIKLIPIERINGIMVVSADPSIFGRLQNFLRQIDIPSESTDPRIFVYAVKNGDAEDISELLDEVFNGKKTESTTAADAQSSTQTENATPAKTLNPFGTESKTTASSTATNVTSASATTNIGKTATATTKKRGESRGSQENGTLAGKIRVIPDKTRNALIIQATPADYQVIEDILARIDVLPRQVLIEVTIADITLDDTTKLGVEWSFTNTEGDDGLISLKLNGESGLAYTIGLTEKWTQALTTLATLEKVNILSAPTILASDNKPAKISVSTKVPVATTEYQYETNTNPVFQTSVQYRDTGIILSVTPRINQNGLVSMEIAQEISKQAGGVMAGGKEYPSFYERSLDTNLTVRDGQTIVIGGLMTEDMREANGGIPFLKDIPILGYLFGSTTSTINKTELIVMITPRVITNLDDVDEISRDFKNKVERMNQTPPIQVPLRF